MKTFALEVWLHPKEGWELIKMLFGALISMLFACVCFGAQECGKKVVDKVRKKV